MDNVKETIERKIEYHKNLTIVDVDPLYNKGIVEGLKIALSDIETGQAETEYYKAMDFLSSEHEQLYNEYLRRDGTHGGDIERKALFYILSGCKDLISKGVHRIYDFSDHRLQFSPDEETMEKHLEQFCLCSSSSALLRLACNLYNGLYPSKSVNDTFNQLDADNKRLAFGGIKIRFEC